MAKVQRVWFLGNGRKDISFDCVRIEHHRASAEVTQNPVETGVKIADHMYDNPDELDVEANVSDVRLHSRDENGTPVQGDLWQTDAGRAATAWLALKGLKESHTPFGVQTGLEFYPNLVLVELETEQDKASAGILRFRAHLEGVTFVSSKTVQYPPRQAGKPHRQASKPVAGGEKATTPETDPERQKTILRTIDPLGLFNQLLSGG